MFLAQGRAQGRRLEWAASPISHKKEQPKGENAWLGAAAASLDRGDATRRLNRGPASGTARVLDVHAGTRER